MTRVPGEDAGRGRPDDAVDAERHQEMARCLFRESNDALFLFDPGDHRVLDVNPAALRLSGYGREACKAMRLRDLFTGEAPGLLDRLIEAYRRTGFYHSREGFLLSRLSGDPLPVNVSVTRIHTRPSPLGLVVARDVSERKRVEAALRESEARYRELIETARVIFWTITPGGRVAALNPQFAAATGWNAEAWVGRPLADLLVPEDRPACEAWIARARDKGPCVPIELRLATRAGAALVLEFLATALGAGGISGIARDVTADRLAAEANRRAEDAERARAAAQAADRAKSDFLAQFSHEVRTPLTTILGYTELLLDDPEVAAFSSDRRDDLENIRRGGAHLLELVNDILDLSEIEAGKIRVAPRDFSPRAVAEEVVSGLSVRAQEKGLTLALAVPAAIPETIYADPVRFRQVLLNLVSNAVKFTDRGGVTVRLRPDPSDPLGPALRAEVADTGVGLSAEHLTHLFEPFYRPTPHASSGSGLGLAICRRLAQAIGGRIAVESYPGRGSTFTLVVPQSSREPSAGADAGAPAPPAPLAPPAQAKLPPGVRILLAEDNEAIRRVATLLLEKLGAAVSGARNGQAAIDAALAARDSGSPFDVILMDMHMPVVDGYEATRQLRGLGFPGLILALTAYAMREDREECLRIGCDEHLSKPIDFQRLSAVIADGLARRDKRPALREA